MAATAGKTAFHLLHGYMGIGAVGFEKFWMTIPAAEKRKVKFVTEYHGPEIWNFYRDLLCQVTRSTLGKSKSPHLVMAQAARFPLFHLSHCNNGIFFADFIQ